jgi:pimeloyl-ACP methyl ester carboxylesterase
MPINIPLPPPAVFLWRWCVRPALIFVGLPYFCVFVMFASFQRSMIYDAKPAESTGPGTAAFLDPQVQQLAIHADDGVMLHGWLIAAQTRGYDDDAAWQKHLDEGKPLVLFFSGNSGNRTRRGDNFRLLASLDADVMVFDYRGYADNQGSPSEAALIRDAHSIWKYATVSRGIAPSRIFLFGESLGGGVATHLAADVCREGTPPGGLILCATFNSLAEVGAGHFPWLPVRWVLIDRFESARWIRDVTCPILQLHPRNDSVVPFPLGQALFEAAPAKSHNGVEKRFVELRDCDHNDILEEARPEYRRALAEFLRVVEQHRGSGS